MDFRALKCQREENIGHSQIREPGLVRSAAAGYQNGERGARWKKNEKRICSYKISDDRLSPVSYVYMEEFN